MKIVHDKEIKIDICEKYFFDNRLLAIYEIAIASNVLYRLGNPICKERVAIIIDGYLEESLKQILEKYISETMNQRTMIRYNCITQNVSVKIINKDTEYVEYLAYTGKVDYECLLLYSNGLDSYLSYEILSQRYVVHKTSWSEEGSEESDKPYPLILNTYNYTYIDTFDNDPWDNYGLYFIYLALLLNQAIYNNVNKISIGLNKDDLFGYDIIANRKISSQCSQSRDFVTIFQKISNVYHVSLVLPLENMTRIDICKTMIERKIDFSQSVSCVFYDGIECGMCFSCFDKLTGILIALAELDKSDKVTIKMENGNFCLRYEGNILMSFKNNINSFDSLEKIPIDYIMKVQLNRIILGEDFDYIRSSKYSIVNVLKVLYYFSKHEIGKVLFPGACILYKNHERQYIEILDEYKL